MPREHGPKLRVPLLNFEKIGVLDMFEIKIMMGQVFYVVATILPETAPTSIIPTLARVKDGKGCLLHEGQGQVQTHAFTPIFECIPCRPQTIVRHGTPGTSRSSVHCCLHHAAQSLTAEPLLTSVHKLSNSVLAQGRGAAVTIAKYMRPYFRFGNGCWGQAKFSSLYFFNGFWC